MDDRAFHYRRAAENVAKAAPADDPKVRDRCLQLAKQFARLATKVERERLRPMGRIIRSS